MTTKAWLQGHQFDLEDLADLLATGDVRVVHDTDEDAYYLSALEIDNPPEANRFDIPAESLIIKVNGLARAKSADFRPVRLSGKYTTSDGRNIHFAAGHLEARARLSGTAVGIGADGQPLPIPPSPWPDYLALVDSHPEVAEVLEIMGRAEPLGWVDLYKVHEIIGDAISPTKITQLGSNTNARDSAFRVSANNPDISGADARHARPTAGDQPKHEMTIAEGRSFVSELVTAWLDSIVHP